MPLMFDLQIGITTTIPVNIRVESTGDVLYDGLENNDLSVYVEDTTPPEILVTTSTTALKEGSLMTYQVALSTTPISDVFMSLEASWLSGFPHSVKLSDETLVFPARKSKSWQAVTLVVPYQSAYLGDSKLAITHTVASADPYYNSSRSSGAQAKTIQFSVSDLDSVGVCLGNCMEITKYDFLFDGTEAETVATPYEIVSGEASLEFMLRTPPLGDVQLQFSASFGGGVVQPALPTSPDLFSRSGIVEETSVAPVDIVFATTSWDASSRLRLLAESSDWAAAAEYATVMVKASSREDPFYDGLEFDFTVYVRPVMLAAASSRTVADPLIPLTVSSGGYHSSRQWPLNHTAVIFG